MLVIASKLFAIAAVALTLSLGKDFYAVALCILGLAHTFVALWLPQGSWKLASRDSWHRICLVAAVAVGLFAASFNNGRLMVFGFGVHHLLTETYAFNKLRTRQLHEKGWIGFRFFSGAVLYLLFSPTAFFLPENSADFLFLLFLLSNVVLFYFSRKDGLLLKMTAANFVFDLGLAILTYFKILDLRDLYIISYYHFWFWIFFGSFRQGNFRLFLPKIPLQHFGLALILLLGFFIHRHYSGPEVLQDWHYEFMRWGYIHIFLSLAQSSLNPEFVLRLLGRRDLVFSATKQMIS